MLWLVLYLRLPDSLQKELAQYDLGRLGKRPKGAKLFMYSEWELKLHILDVSSASRGRIDLIQAWVYPKIGQVYFMVVMI